MRLCAPWFLAVALALWYLRPRTMIWVTSSVNGKGYLVKNMPGHDAVADRLAVMERRIVDFLRAARREAPGDPRIQNILARWNGTLGETPRDEDIAYSVAKDSVYVCVRARDDPGRLEDMNTCMFVLLHELAHVATDSYGHEPEFWANMRFLLELAEATGFYEYQDFDNTRVSYCGKELGGSPLACVKDGSCPSQLAARRRAQ